MAEYQNPKAAGMPVRPKLAATLVLMREINGRPEILMGKRSARHDFMPSVYVFPGGRVDRRDSYTACSTELDPVTRDILATALSTTRARACAVAAVRETYEESSLVIDKSSNALERTSDEVSWSELINGGYQPDISGLELFGRAITPPCRTKRFDTWFFLLRLNEEIAAQKIGTSAELIHLDWFGLAEAENIKTAQATSTMLGILTEYLQRPARLQTVQFMRMEYGHCKLSPFPVSSGFSG